VVGIAIIGRLDSSAIALPKPGPINVPRSRTRLRVTCRFANLTAFECCVIPVVSVSLQNAFWNDVLP
jgi:hypothetical protein